MHCQFFLDVIDLVFIQLLLDFKPNSALCTIESRKECDIRQEFLSFECGFGVEAPLWLLFYSNSFGFCLSEVRGVWGVIGKNGGINGFRKYFSQDIILFAGISCISFFRAVSYPLSNSVLWQQTLLLGLIVSFYDIILRFRETFQLRGSSLPISGGQLTCFCLFWPLSPCVLVVVGKEASRMGCLRQVIEQLLGRHFQDLLIIVVNMLQSIRIQLRVKEIDIYFSLPQGGFPQVGVESRVNAPHPVLPDDLGLLNFFPMPGFPQGAYDQWIELDQARMQNGMIEWMVQEQIDQLQVLQQFWVSFACLEAFPHHGYDVLVEVCGDQGKKGLFYSADTQFADVPEVHSHLFIESVGLHQLQLVSKRINYKQQRDVSSIYIQKWLLVSLDAEQRHCDSQSA